MAPQEQIQHLPLELIVVERQVRETFDEDALHGLLLSLKEVGQLLPIRVREANGKYVMIDGECRLRCLRKLGASTVAAIVEARELNAGQIVQQQLIANVQRFELLSIEKAKAVRRLMDETEWNASMAAVRLGMSAGSVSKLLMLLTLSPEIQAQIANGSIAMSTAYELAKIDDVDQQAELAKQVVSGMTREQLVGARKSAKRSKREPSPKSVSRVTAVLGMNKSVTVAGPLSTLDDAISLLEDCLAKARQGRTRGISLSTFVRLCKDTAAAAHAT